MTVAWKEAKRKRILKKIKKEITAKALDLSDPKMYDDFCRRYGEAIRPELERIDRMRKRSMEKMLTKVVS